MTGQTHQWFAAGLTQNSGFTGFDRDTVQEQTAHGFNDPAGCILYTYTAAAGQQYRITFRNRFCYLFRKQRFIVNNNSIIDDSDTECTQHSLQHGAVYIPHLSGTGCDFRRNQFVTGGDHAHRQLLHHRNLYSADGSQSTDILRRQHSAFLQNGFTGVDIIATEDHILSWRNGFENADCAVTVVFRVLHHYHAVRTLRYRTAGRNRHTVICLQCHIRTLSHEHLALLGKDRGNGIGTAKSISCPHCETIHSRTVKIRYIFRSSDILGKHSAHGRSQRNGFCPGNRLKFCFNQCQNFFRRFYVQHIRPP